MKARTTIFMLALIIIGASSCNKEADWECKCDIDGKESILVIFDEKKKDARSECKDTENNTNYKITNCRLAGKDQD